MNKNTTRKVTYLPIDKFVAISLAGHRQPDPVPAVLFAAAFLFVITALFTM